MNLTTKRNEKLKSKCFNKIETLFNPFKNNLIEYFSTIFLFCVKQKYQVSNAEI